MRDHMSGLQMALCAATNSCSPIAIVSIPIGFPRLTADATSLISCSGNGICRAVMPNCPRWMG